MVRDTGIGIPAAELPRVFERFHRIEGQRGRTHEGTGIGLALVEELVKLHGGTIAVRACPGEGTRFRVAIPLGTAHLPPEQIGDGGTAASDGDQRRASTSRRRCAGCRPDRFGSGAS